MVVLIDFRKMELEEIDEVAKITIDAFSAYYPNYSLITRKKEIKSLIKEITELIQHSISKYYVLTKSDIIVGSVALTLYEKSCYLNSMVISNSMQKQGLGTEFLPKILETVENNKFGDIILYANHSGRKLYENAGFNSNFRVTPLKIDFIPLPKFRQENKVEFNFELPSWIEELESKTFGKPRNKLYDYLISREMDLLTLKEKAFCTLREQTIGNFYAKSDKDAIELLYEAWNLGGNYFNSIQNDTFDQISRKFSYTPLDEVSCIKMTKNIDTRDFSNYYGILSFGFG